MSEQSYPGISGTVGEWKHRLQFTGWLQYLPNAVAAVIAMAAGAILLLTPLMWLAVTVWCLAGLLTAVLLYDLATVKLGWHPRESLPAPPRATDPFDLMRSRMSNRSFQRRYLTDTDRQLVMDSVTRWTGPDAGQIGTAGIRLTYVRAQLTVWPAIGAREFLVAIAPAQYDRLANIDVGRSLQLVVNELTAAGIATCWIGPGADQSSVIDHLGAAYESSRDHIVCLCAIGYRSRYRPVMLRLMTRLQHRRLPLDELFLLHVRPPTPLPRGEPPFERLGRTFEVCQWAPSSFDGQTTRMVAMIRRPDDEGSAGPREVIGFSFLATTDSRWYAPVALGIWCANWQLGAAALGIVGTFAPAAGAGVDDVRLAGATVHHDVDWLLAEPMLVPTTAG